MTHPVDEELAPLYALGALTQHEAQLFEEHLAEECEKCRTEVEECQAVAGLLGVGAGEAVPRERVRERLVESVRTDRAGGLRQKDAVPPNITIRASEGIWQETWRGISVKSLFVDEQRGTVTTLVKMAPGAHLPRHRHNGVEECLVLEGDVQAGEQALVAGDYHCAMADSIHEPLSTINGALLMIVGPKSFEVLERA